MKDDQQGILVCSWEGCFLKPHLDPRQRLCNPAAEHTETPDPECVGTGEGVGSWQLIAHLAYLSAANVKTSSFRT